MEVVTVWRGIKLEGLQVVVGAGSTGAGLSVWDPYQWGCLFFHLCVSAICCWPMCRYLATGAVFGKLGPVG